MLTWFVNCSPCIMYGQTKRKLEALNRDDRPTPDTGASLPSSNFFPPSKLILALNAGCCTSGGWTYCLIGFFGLGCILDCGLRGCVLPPILKAATDEAIGPFVLAMGSQAEHAGTAASVCAVGLVGRFARRARWRRRSRVCGRRSTYVPALGSVGWS